MYGKVLPERLKLLLLEVHLCISDITTVTKPMINKVSKNCSSALQKLTFDICLLLILTSKITNKKGCLLEAAFFEIL